MNPTPPILFCDDTDPDFHNDDIRRECVHPAAYMCWTVSGEWQPRCERHAVTFGYVQNGRALALTTPTTEYQP